jgi:uncharacterized protein
VAIDLRSLLDVPPPPGRSRESSIRLDSEGHFHHEEEPFLHLGLAAAMHSWITRHPENGRYVLYNGYDWSYFQVADAPFVVRHLREDAQGLWSEPLWLGDANALYVGVKRALGESKPLVAKFSRYAQTQLEPYLTEKPSGEIAIRTPEGEVLIGPKPDFG